MIEYRDDGVIYAGCDVTEEALRAVANYIMHMLEFREYNLAGYEYNTKLGFGISLVVFNNDKYMLVEKQGD